MGHLLNGKDEVYRALAERLSRFPVGAVVNETFIEILRRLYTESEAAVGSKFPLKPMSYGKILEMTGIKEQELKTILEQMAAKGLVVDIPRKDTVYYMLSPMVVGFFEYTFMRAGELGNREMAELFDRYFQEDGVAQEIFGSETKLFKAFVYERLIPEIVHTEVMSYEKAAEVVRQSGGGSLSMCACRHKASHLGKACQMPVEDICTSLGRPSEWLVRRGLARYASVDDLLRNLERSERLGLVLLVDNVLQEPAYICHCCGCCCGVLRSISEKKVMSVHPSNFIPAVDASLCSSCAVCEESCHISAIAMGGSAGLPVLDNEICIGCGVCANSCPSGALTMEQRKTVHTPPENKIAQYINIAIERNRF
jgi:ferredoxin